MKLLNYFYLYNINKLILFNSLCLFQLLQDLRTKSQEIALNNVTLHVLFRLRYRKLEQSLMVENEQSRQGTAYENVETRVTSPPLPPFRHVKWKRAWIKKSGAPSSKQSGVIIEKIVSYFYPFCFYFKALIILKTGMIFVSCMILWNPKVILFLKVVTISWLKQLYDLSTVVVFMQLNKRLELNYILEFHNDTHSPPPKRPKHKWWVRYVKN